MQKNLNKLKKGEIFFGEVKDTQGHEQKGERPLLVISEDSFNAGNDFVLVMPLSNKGRKSDDAFEIETVNGNVKGYVLTQHISPYYEDFITSNSLKVDVVDFAVQSTIVKVFEMYNAITAITSYKANNFQQGDIVKATVAGKRINAVVLSESSFNQVHNTVWVAPIVTAKTKQLRGDHVLIQEFSDEINSKYSYVLCEHVKNIEIKARKVEKIKKTITNNELKKCNEALSTFL